MHRRHRRIAGITAAATLLLAAGCGGDDETTVTATTSPTVAASTTATADAPAVAPYIDIVSGTVDIDEVAEQTGQDDYTLAFLLADTAGTCTATWGGSKALDDSTVQAEIAKIAALDGDVIVSTGGATGTYLESVCTADELAAAYSSALDAAGSNALDVDIEQTVTAATVTQALRTLQTDRGTAITLTVPVGGTVLGLTDTSIALLQSAADAGLDVTVNAMTMNFTEENDDWGASMTTATEAVVADVKSVWTTLSDAEAYQMLGVTPMIGVNDTGPITETADAQTLLDYAEEKGLGFVRFWSVNRDNGGCTTGEVEATCSGIAQETYEFTKMFADFTN
ncbi:putative glycosyl hydrolase [Actinoplanes missouriensis 431]|uniref:Putative glycosyl hydrolase n=1 Tax=Actinoplanes missouriensis (strain ATCC 14538 / DSM 43046 / CBS 188.64 / JCM 3121 / NBRC 102363 / NCIMB 12654 / NRRL B-3342 / UNCC 431) TaxID=512565 RepID=I0HHG2_ACTM4|nr:glycosyl hydrolase [Actinoplanes missouriensis]BAL92449.1 putative glycosyl hydrolase [Actinoplanes missouriensis 431]